MKYPGGVRQGRCIDHTDDVTRRGHDIKPSLVLFLTYFGGSARREPIEWHHTLAVDTCQPPPSFIYRSPTQHTALVSLPPPPPPPPNSPSSLMTFTLTASDKPGHCAMKWFPCTYIPVHITGCNWGMCITHYVIPLAVTGACVSHIMSYHWL